MVLVIRPVVTVLLLCIVVVMIGLLLLLLAHRMLGCRLHPLQFLVGQVLGRSLLLRQIRLPMVGL